MELRLIKSFYISGLKSDPSNYRRIASCLGKPQSTFLYKHVKRKVEYKNVLLKAQAGFRKKNRITDHSFPLLILVKKFIRSGKKLCTLYTCFADFRKVCDSICRKRLILRIKEIALIRKILKTIETIYSSPKRFFHLLHLKIESQSFTN